jgi:hypothetical protein
MYEYDVILKWFKRLLYSTFLLTKDERHRIEKLQNSIIVEKPAEAQTINRLDSSLFGAHLTPDQEDTSYRIPCAD